METGECLRMRTLEDHELGKSRNYTRVIKMGEVKKQTDFIDLDVKCRGEKQHGKGRMAGV